MTGQVTVTAKTGPARQETALVLTSLKRMEFDLEKSVLHVVRNTADKGEETRDYDLVGVTTVTCTISGTTYTWVVS